MMHADFVSLFYINLWVLSYCESHCFTFHLLSPVADDYECIVGLQPMAFMTGLLCLIVMFEICTVYRSLFDSELKIIQREQENGVWI